MGPMRRSVAVASMLLAVLAGACIPATSLRSTPTPPPEVSATAATIETPAPPSIASGEPSFVRPTPTPLPTFLPYVVKKRDTLGSIARAYRTTARSIAFWNRAQHPSLDPDSASYQPDRIDIAWVLLLVPDLELDPEDLPPDPTATPSQAPAVSASPT